MEKGQTQAEEDVLLFDVLEGGIALLRFNRPQVGNAVNGEAARALAAAVERIESDTSLHVAVLASSTPGMFSAGADLKAVAAGKIGELRQGDSGFAALVDALRSKPWIAAVDGPAMVAGSSCAWRAT